MDVEWDGDGERMGKKQEKRERQNKESEVPVHVPQGWLNQSALQVCEWRGKHCLSKQRFAQQPQHTRSV